MIYFIYYKGVKMKYKIGQLVNLPETRYKGIIGTVIAENKAGILVRFNGSQQLYFKEEELKACKK